MPVEESPGTLVERASQALIESGEAAQAALEAQQDGIISNDELDRIQRECDEAIEAITRLKQIARRER